MATETKTTWNLGGGRGVLIGTVLLALAATFTLVTKATARAEANIETCRASMVADVQSERLSCQLPYALTAEQREDIADQTSGMIQDLRCLVAVDISRADVVATRTMETWQAPKQRARCQVETSVKRFDADVSVTPTLQFDSKGRAYAAKINVDDVEDLPLLVAKELASYIKLNHSAEAALLAVINGYREGAPPPEKAVQGST